MNAQAYLDQAALRAHLPQRGALFACDSLQVLAPLRFTGTGRWDAGHPGLEGHFPESPTVPGVLLLECASQLAGVGLLQTQTDLQQCQDSHRGVLASIRQCRFRSPVRPGLNVAMHLTCRRRGRLQFQIQAHLAVDGVAVADLDFLLIYVPRAVTP